MRSRDWRQAHQKSKNSVDTFQRIPLKEQFHSVRRSLGEGGSRHFRKNQQRKTVLKRAGRFNRSHHLFLAPPHEKKSAFKEVTEFAA